MPGEAGRLGRDALLEVAVGADGVGPVVDDLVARPVELLGQPPLRDGHARRRSPRPGRAGRSSPRRPASRRTPGGPASASPTGGSASARRAGGRSRSGGGASRRASRRGRPTGRSGRGSASRGGSARGAGSGSRGCTPSGAMPIGAPGMPGVRLLDAVDREGPDRVDREPVELLGGEGGHRARLPWWGGGEWGHCRRGAGWGRVGRRGPPRPVRLRSRAWPGRFGDGGAGLA